MTHCQLIRGVVIVLLVATVLLTPGKDQAVAVSDILRKPRSKGVEIVAEPDPGSLAAYRNRIGKSFYFEITGSATGTVWGTRLYTAESTLAVAAVHAGVLRAGQKGFVKVTMLPGRTRFQGSTRNGVTSNPYPKRAASYLIEPVGPRVRVRSKTVLVKALPDPGNVAGYRGQTGKTFFFEVTGTTTGTVWGTGVYTDDSPLGAVAVHASLLRNGQKGVIKVTILAGQAAYNGSNQNGVTSANYGNWGGSYMVELVKIK